MNVSGRVTETDFHQQWRLNEDKSHDLMLLTLLFCFDRQPPSSRNYIYHTCNRDQFKPEFGYLTGKTGFLLKKKSVCHSSPKHYRSAVLKCGSAFVLWLSQYQNFTGRLSLPKEFKIRILLLYQYRHQYFKL